MLRSLPEIVQEARSSLRCLNAVNAMAESKEKNGVIIDVREPGEVQAKPAPSSTNVPRGILEMKIIEMASASDHPIYLHCASGGRAALAAEQLVRMGYTEVTVITCPIDVVCETQRL